MSCRIAFAVDYERIGIRIEQSEEGITISQTDYIDELIKRFGMQLRKSGHIHTPGLVGNAKRLNASMSPQSDTEREEASKYPYAEALGALQWLVGATRPDIGQAVNMACRYLSNPGKQHWEAVERILLYLRNTREEKFFFPHQSNGDLIVEAFSDADYATCSDTRRSQSGAVIKINGCTVFARSALQKIVTLSPMESEYVAAVECAQQVVHIRRIVEDDLGHAQPGNTRIYCDNDSAILLSERPINHSRSKHIDVRWHWIREQTTRGILRLFPIGTKDQQADILTKSPPMETFNRLKQRILGTSTWSHPSPLR